MPGLAPGIDVFAWREARGCWMQASLRSPHKRTLMPGHDEIVRNHRALGALFWPWLPRTFRVVGGNISSLEIPFGADWSQ
jgi:hypothetical protein